MSVRSELTGDDPIALFERWMAEATASEPNDPNAAALATATRDAVPSVRMVLIKGVTPAGFSFFTNQSSRKGMELTENPRAALCLHWKSLRRQVRVMGPVSLLPEEAVDDYFHQRSRASQIGASVSLQSKPLASRTVLEEAVAKFAHAHEDGEIPRPSFWRGYLLAPDSIEFWMDGEARLHDRRLFTRTHDRWVSSLLYP